MTQRPARHARRPAPLMVEPVESRLLMAVAPIDIEGVYNASLDQPRTYAMLQRSPTGDPLTAVEGDFAAVFRNVSTPALTVVAPL